MKLEPYQSIESKVMLNIFNDDYDITLSRSIEGSLSLMPLADLIQWIEGSKKSGTLITEHEDCTRSFFFQDGRLIFIWCDKEGQTLLDAIHDKFELPVEHIEKTLNQSKQLAISFVGLLSSEEGIPLDQLGGVISSLAETYLTSSMSWRSGHFRFNDFLPPCVLCSPVSIRPTQVLLDSVVILDESHRYDQTRFDPLLNEIHEMIQQGTIDIPPLPAEMQLLMEKINDPHLTIEQIIECLHDPLLVSKVLRVCNSPFYGRRGKVDTLRDAVVYMGLKSLMSIVTVNALSGFSPQNSEQIEQILHHSMMVGMIAKQLARDMGGNHDQAFVCGLLHDLGWIVMLEILSKYDLEREMRDHLIREHHEAVGALVAQKWDFPEDIQEVIRYHHSPEKTRDHNNLVQIIHLSDLLAKNEAPLPDDMTEILSMHSNEWAAPFTDHLEELDREIDSILSQH